MEASSWVAEHWFDVIQTVGIIGGLLFTAFAIRRDEKARRISNLVSITDHYRQIWKEVYDRPKLSRVLEKHVDVKVQPPSNEEGLFINFLILHLSCVHQAMMDGMFIALDGLQADIKEFFSLPIPRAVWEKSKRLQNHSFVKFVEACLFEN
ncbi:MAG TPA: hypothetical protein VNL17_11520 [Verrucomicrobiae bacterium]|nr:hypothetical protein [Verrucomicrobiae bacterium]